MSTDGGPDVTRLLDAAGQGDAKAANELLPLVYEQLRQLAAARMALQPSEHTLQATALVHEAYLRLVGGTSINFAGRRHFFFAAAQAMRQILIDHARANGSSKRGGERRKLPLNNVLDLMGPQQLPQILDLDEALSRLEEQAPDVVAMVRLRFYGGLSIEEAADTLGVSPSTINARAELYTRQGKSKEAAADVERLIELGNSNETSAVRNRAIWYKRLGRFAEALADRARVIMLDPSDFGSWEELAALHLYLGHEKEYLAARQKLLDRLKEQKGVTDHPLKTSLLFPLDADELKVCMAIADRNNVPSYKAIHMYHFDKGLAEYRGGNYGEAMKWLKLGREDLTALIATHPEERDLSLHPHSSSDEVRTTDEFVIAMCEYRLGHPEQAREAMARARDLLRTYTPSASSGRLKVGSLDWLMVQIIAREAEKTIPANDPTTMPATNPSATHPASDLTADK
ncbi:MAG TPA: ECF-type sigma factor [Tepidisphaeraceae bacterium]|jgi:RNA polymerase sigma factor (TIGR02999 family)